MSFESITNRGEFFSNHYVDAVLAGDLGDLRSSWEDAEARGEATARSRLKGGATAFFAARADADEARGTSGDALRRLHDVVLGLLSFTPDRSELEFKQNTEYLLDVPVAAKVDTSTGLLLVAVEAGNASTVDDLFDFDERQLHTGTEQAGQLRAPVIRNVDKRSVHSAADAVGEVFNTDEPPRYVLVVAGSVVLLAERAKWSEGRFLAVDLGLAFDRNDASAKGELETIAALFSLDALAPVGGQSPLETLVEKSHKHAVGVSKELRSGIRESIELIANEVISQRDARARQRSQKLFTRTDVDARELTRQSLRYLYRLIVLLYAESRPDLGIVPANDQDYVDGYSLDRLRELCLVELDDDHSRNGSHFQQSLDRLFELVNGGYNAESAEQQLLFADSADAGLDDLERRSTELYIQFPGLDAQLFSPASTSLINEVPLRNEMLQHVLRKLMLAPGKRRNDAAGFISYAQLGINQLGAVYEGLMAYTGFYASTDLNEVAKGGDPADGTWMLPVDDAGEYPDDVFVMTTDEVTGRKERVVHPEGTFVFRLSGRDRQRSASYYTPEVLTRCVVKHALAELLGLDDYAPENGSSGIVNAVDLLDLTICEPALGSGAFANEAINQLADEYLRRRQAELGEVLNPAQRDVELQKVKAHFALHQTYGVDLNATAVELAEVSLWLNAMHPGLKAPWFGLQLRQGNSLVGCRRSTWAAGQLGDRPWAQTKAGSVIPPIDRPLSEQLADGEIHHFLLPGHGWAAVADRKEAKELRPDEVESLKNWRKAVLKAPTKSDAKRLTSLTAGIEAMWAASTALIAATQKALRREIGVYGTDTSTARSTPISREKAIAALNDEDSPLGRLRTLMDAWTGLWFWPLDSGERPPSWNQWLAVAEELIRPDERHGLTGQLDLFADLDRLLDAEKQRQEQQITAAELKDSHAWLAIAVDAARHEGAWHWELEFAPVFSKSGFDLQVGNPPWVRPIWRDDLVLAEQDPWWGVTAKPSAAAIKERRSADLDAPETRRSYLRELATSEGIGKILGSPLIHPLLAGIQTNLYMVFMDTAWKNLSAQGVSGLLHPESHFTDPKGGALRRRAYEQLRRHWQFQNALFLFEEIHDMNVFGVHISGRRQSVAFKQMSTLFHPDTIDKSLEHDGDGEQPGIQHLQGGWDTRPHASRIVTITEDVLADWAKLFDDPGTPAAEARLLRPITTSDLEALATLADQPVRLAEHEYDWTAGWHEKGARTNGTIRWETAVPRSWNDVILQGPHFTVATPFYKQPNDGCRNNLDYREWDLESLPATIVPRTNYQPACDRETYISRMEQWNGSPNSASWRLVWRAMTQPGAVRSLQAALLQPGPSQVGSVFSLAFSEPALTALAVGLWSSIPLDYLVKVSGVANIKEFLARRFPMPTDTGFDDWLRHRVLRLNCLTVDYAPIWSNLHRESWCDDEWTSSVVLEQTLRSSGSEWTTLVPLRRDRERWQALVELDALSALMLELSSVQLSAMYRTQFAVLRKYEYKMVFDAEGRKICGYHQSAGFRQSQLQDQAKAGDLPAEWTNLWNLYEQYEAEPDSVDWLGLYSAPFTRVDREVAMTRAYNEFQRRLDAGEYGPA
ncbi:Eco57I restriction-modification methylase domain-containing protein [Ilumatobacter sp.]|uniref:Eco57I restriction-modification methylase domain-containing protein n=1 Tax=Ilumatobacter sp. TaxID=1967498 RepID=UPI003751D915